ncbi:hypothetical protein [Micromonospora sp. KC721]|uniref:hypothetical protein n=1 Tax=Micromonospora sp. KC721 TaxID=2530380 RepID=UPI001FB7625D|nr:hypothetical protein [Micromonospora sp. KC721]
MADNEMAEIHQRATAAMTAAIQAAGQLAQVLIDVRIAQLRRAERVSEEQARRIRAQARAAQQADAAVWRPAMRPGWWRTAGTEDIARVWRAASTWQHVDPRAQQARQVVVDQLAKRAGTSEKHEPAREPDDIEVLSDAVDRAVREATERSSRPAMSAEAVRDRQERMAAEVRKAWPSGQRADRVLGCEAWGALAYTLDQAQQAGHDVQQLLRGVPSFVDRARTPGAFACRVVQDQLDGRVDLGTVRRDRSQETANEQAAHTEPFGPEALADVEPAGVGGDQPADREGILARVDPPAESTATSSEPAVVAARAFPVSTRDAVTAAKTGSDAAGQVPAVKAVEASLDSPSR